MNEQIKNIRNTRIRELAAQSGMIYYSKTKALENANDGMTVIPSLDGLEKFAELIVKECAELMPQDNLYNMVLKHFGVEE